jgi:hypothetical protein
MTSNQISRIIGRLFIAAFTLTFFSCQISLFSADTEPSQGQAPDPPQENALTITSDYELPETHPGARYEFHFTARGGVPVLHWRLEKGALPPGLKLEDSGMLHGAAERSGEFQFTLAVNDEGKPQQAVQKAFVLRVRSALVLNWKSPARVNGNRIDGSAEVSNNTADDIDLTFVVLAVATNGRATAIGYQHFVLARDTTKDLPFGDTLPHGNYVVHVDAIGEVAPKKLIYRERMQTPGPLFVAVGP